MSNSGSADTFDYVIVGAGTAGCVLANRLSAAGHSICILEAGPRDWNPMIHIPAGYIKNLYSKTLTWNFVSEPGPGVGGRSFSLPQGPALLVQILRWLVGLPSPLAISPSVVHIFAKSDPALDRPDLEFACAPASFREGVVGLLDKQPGLTLGVWQERPESLGYTEIRSRDPFERPIIQPNYLTHPEDVKALLGGIRLARQLFRAGPLQKYVVDETSPAKSLETDDELLDFARQKGTTVYHMIGTARMGPAEDPNTVVNHKLQVHGMQNLRVIDASIMPSMPSANTNATTYMIAEKGADMILAEKV